MRKVWYFFLFCIITANVWGVTLPAPTNLTATAMRNADGRQYFHLTFTASDTTLDTNSYYRIYRWKGAVPDTTGRVYIVGLRATNAQQQSYDDTSYLFNPTSYDSNFVLTYSYAVYLEEYVQHPTDSLYAYFSSLSNIATASLDSVYLYFTSVPSSSISESVHDTMRFTFQAKESYGSSSIIYTANSSNSSIAVVSIDSSTGSFECIAVGSGSASVTVRAKDAVGRACYYTFKFMVAALYDTLNVTLKDKSTGLALAAGTRDYWRLFTPGDSGRDNSYSLGTSLLNSSGGIIVLFQQGNTLHLRVGAEGYNASWVTDSLGNEISIHGGESLTVYLSSAATHTISGTATDTTANKPINGARMVFIRVLANDGYIGIDTMYTDTTGDYQFTYSEGDSLLGTLSIRVFAYASGYADSNQETAFLSSLEDHTNANFHFGVAGHGTSDTAQYFHIVPATGDTTADAIHTLTYLTIYKLADTGFVVFKRDTTDSGYWPINLYKGKYIIFAQPDTGYQSGYYSIAGYAANWTEADTLVVPVSNSHPNTANTVFVILEKDSSLALQGGGAHIAGIVYNKAGNIAPDAHLLLYQEINAPAGGNTSKLLYTTTSDSLAGYSFTRIPPGTYTVLVDIVGQSVYESQTITINEETDSVAFNITYNPNAVKQGPNATPSQMGLVGNYPNPFSQGTDVTFTLTSAADVTLTVFDETGRAIGATLAGSYAQGAHTIHIDASSLPAGMYSYVVMTNGRRMGMQRMVIVK